MLLKQRAGLYIALLLLKFIPPYVLKIKCPFKGLPDFHNFLEGAITKN